MSKEQQVKAQERLGLVEEGSSPSPTEQPQVTPKKSPGQAQASNATTTQDGKKASRRAPVPVDGPDSLSYYEPQVVPQKGQEKPKNSRPKAVSMSFGEILDASFPPPEPILEPLLFSCDVLMLFAKRGAGKSLFMLQIAHNLAAGIGFLKWKAYRPWRVLYIDGELPQHKIQKRCLLAKSFVEKKGIKIDESLVNKNLRIINRDFQPRGMVNLCDKTAYDWLKDDYDWAEIIIYDSLLTLAPSKNDITKGETFLPIQNLLFDLRTQGKTLILLHHAGKGGDQLGDISKETIFDTVMSLEQVKEQGSNPDETRLRVNFTKTRDLHGDDAASFVAIVDGVGGWTWKRDKSLEEQIKELAEFLTVRDMAEELHVSKSTIGRIMKENGIVPKGRKQR